MTPEEVARCYQFREGFNLVDYGEVGLPVFRLTIEAITLTQRTLPTIHEFVMRCLALGESREDAIARMLGLRVDVVNAAVNALVIEGLVARQGGSSDLQNFSLTETGSSRLMEESIEVPQEEMLVIDYDGIRRIPIRLAGTSVVKAAELKASGALEIRPYPAEPPAIETLSIPDVTRVVRRQRGEDFNRAVLALKRVVRRNNVYREAVALAYVADKGNEVQVAFAIDGKLSEAHERAFAEHGGPKKMGFLKTLAESDPTKQLNLLLGKRFAQAVPSKADLAALRKAEADAEAAIRNIRPAAERSGKGQLAAAALLSAQRDLLSARELLSKFLVRPLYCYEVSSLLLGALDSAEKRLLITSHGLQASLINPTVMQRIDRLIELDVSVRVEISVPIDGSSRSESRYDPRQELTKRSLRALPILVGGPKRSLYFLVKDTDLAVVSNRPFFGDPFRRSGFFFVSGVVIRDPEFIEKLYQELTKPEVRNHG